MSDLRPWSRWSPALVLLALGCGTPNEAHITKLATPVAPDASANATATFATLLSYDVIAPQDRATLLIEYCQRTDLPVESEAGITRCGPFLSRYEAAFIAGLVPGASTRQHDQYMDGARVDPWLKVRSPYARTPVYVGTRLVAGHRFALVTWELEDASVEARRRLEGGSEPEPETPAPPAGKPEPQPQPQTPSGKPAKPEGKPGDAPAGDKPKEPPPKPAVTEQELYEVVGAGPHLMTRLPWLDARRSASGLAIAQLAGESVYLEVKAARQKGARSERLRAFQWDLNGSEPVFERELLTLQKNGDKPESVLVLSVTRVKPAARGLELSTYKATFAPRPEAKGVDLELNDWSAPRWQSAKEVPANGAPAKAPPTAKPPVKDDGRLPDLVDLKSVEPAGKSFESLESFGG
ncbi:MAG: hypothetical protein JNK04_20500 [Myxococcales bacterium]|nr:hypothetical protein [Myxococcales bacterium]